MELPIRLALVASRFVVFALFLALPTDVLCIAPQCNLFYFRLHRVLAVTRVRVFLDWLVQGLDALSAKLCQRAVTHHHVVDVGHHNVHVWNHGFHPSKFTERSDKALCQEF